MTRSRRTIRRLVIWRVGEATLVLVLVGVVVFLSLRIQDARRQIAERYLILEQDLGSMVHMTELKDELALRQHDINRILAFVPERQALGDVVGALERVAKQGELIFLVPDVKEEVKLDEKGEPVEPTGPLREVRLHLVASGAPEETLRWLHAVEHQPYLLTVVNWSFATALEQARPGVGVAGPSSGPAGLNSEKELEERRVGTIEADVIVTILAK